MAGSAFWKGYLKLSLVTCRVAMQPAITQSEKLRFHTLNRVTGNRVESRWIDSGTGTAVASDDLASAYERGEDDYIILEDDELARVRLDSTRTIDIDRFVPAGSIPWLYYDAPHYLMPDDEVSGEAFDVIRAAMAASGMAGLARLVLYRRERALLLLPHERGIIAWTLRYGTEVRAGVVDELGEPTGKPDAQAMKLAEKLIAAQTGKWSPGLLRDPVEEKLHDILAAKRGRKAAPARKAPAEKPGSNVVSIMDALKQSLAREKGGKR